MTKFIDIVEVTKLTALSKSSIYDFARRGLFPRPIKLSLRRVAWVEAEVETWIEDKIGEARP